MNATELRDETEKQTRLWRSNLLIAESNRETRRAAKMFEPKVVAVDQCLNNLHRLSVVMKKIEGLEGRAKIDACMAEAEAAGEVRVS